MKKNMLKLAVASGTLLAVGATFVASANSAEDVSPSVNGRCQVIADGMCGPTPLGRAWFNGNNTHVTFWSHHNLRRHRPVGTIGRTVVRPDSWGSANRDHSTARLNRPAGASLSVTWETN